LFGMDRDFRPQPERVGSWQISDDKLTYTFHLRDGLKFHDGQPVRAADAVASLKQWGQMVSRCSPPRQRSKRLTTANSGSC
jgi:peptide/nickel transport system substrate-binding protein